MVKTIVMLIFGLTLFIWAVAVGGISIPHMFSRDLIHHWRKALVQLSPMVLTSRTVPLLL
jgi:hypothetical protein